MTTKTLKTFDYMEFIESSVLFKLLKASMFSLFTGMAGAITTLITGYIWDSAPAVYTLVSLMIGDWAIGTVIAIRASYILRSKKEILSPKKRAEHNKRKFSLIKFFSIIFSIVLGLWLLGIAWNVSKANALYGFLPGFVYFAFTGAYLISAYRKITYLGYFSSDFLEALEDKLQIRNFIGKKKDE